MPSITGFGFTSAHCLCQNLSGETKVPEPGHDGRRGTPPIVEPGAWFLFFTATVCYRRERCHPPDHTHQYIQKVTSLTGYEIPKGKETQNYECNTLAEENAEPRDLHHEGPQSVIGRGQDSVEFKKRRWAVETSITSKNTEYPRVKYTI